MYGSLTGSVTGHLNQRTLVDVQGVGFWVHTGTWQPEGAITCYLHHQVREDISELYGFPDLDALALFEQLIGISGIGPKAGLAILSLGDIVSLKQAILQGDTKYLSSAPGIGQKAAQKIILELQSKMDVLPSLITSLPSAANADLIAALEGLGYRTHDIRNALKELPETLDGIDAQLKWALQRL